MLAHAHANILFGPRNEAAALYRLPTPSYTRAPEREKRQLLERYAYLAFQLDADISVHRVCRLDGDSWFVEAYAVVSLGAPQPAGALQRLWSSLDLSAHRVESLAGVAARPGITAATLEAAMVTEEQTLSTLQTALGLDARRATTDELQWLLRRGATRGIAEPMVDEHWTPDALVLEDGYEPLPLPPLHEGLQHEAPRHLILETELGTSHQALLALGALPEVAQFPGEAELLCLPLEAVPFPVDAVVHARVIRNRDAIGTVRRRVIDADNAYAEQLRSDHGPLSFAAEENRQLARELEASLSSTARPPLLRCSVSLAVGAPDAKTLDERVSAVRAQFGSVALHRPLGVQPALYAAHALRSNTGAVHAYDQILTVEQWAALMATGTEAVGSSTGPTLGHLTSGSRRPVRFDPAEAPRLNRTPSVLIAGTLGSGKTVCAQGIAHRAALMGSRVIDVDPKPDHELASMPGLEGLVEEIELSGQTDRPGLLDPLRVAPETLREELAYSYLLSLLPAAPPEWQTAIRRTVRDVLREPKPSSSAVLRSLSTSGNDAAAAGDALSVWAESGLGRLAFGDPGQDELPPDLPVTTIRTPGLALPSAETPRSDYDAQERLSVATLKLVAAFALGLVTGDRSQHKLLVIDEAWFLLASRDGRRLVEHLNRLGRTENATLVLATQRISDATEVESLVGTRLMFRQETVGEARAALELLGLEPDDEGLVERVMSFPAGRCLMRDVQGKVGEVYVEA